MPHQPATETAVSAPGKVLLTGGYLVLDRAYTGGVYALDARIHVVVQQLQKNRDGKLAGTFGVGVRGPEAKQQQQTSQDGATGPESQHNEREEETDEVVIVRSPQFIDALWEYRVVRVSDGGGIKVVQMNDGVLVLSRFFSSFQSGPIC
jgi:phosphomevalonate kinase